MNRKLSLQIIGQPDPTAVKDVHLVGRYALGVTWGDDHGSIYPFEALRRACACGACGAEVPAGAAAWPQEIKRLPEGVRVTWSDGHTSLYAFPELRAACRCAGCTGGH
ncbi:MAG TPA: gamma-butyrobetaine hydroxylase-like domain-containing protein [Methylomirabilota bacterium]|nr:gamma-butyrobetaine hydroxylase-like domain-containing protein [Methylomirabilota bacterium]